jgi:hypothetical protein
MQVLPTKDQIDKQKKLNSTKSNTIPTLVIWLFYLVAVIVWRVILKVRNVPGGDEFDLQALVWIAGGATFAYMLGGHVTDIIRNKSLPAGIGEIKDINRYKVLIFFWIGVTLIATIAYFGFGVTSLPHSDILVISGALSVEYIAGNRANKIATQHCPGVVTSMQVEATMPEFNPEVSKEPQKESENEEKPT